MGFITLATGNATGFPNGTKLEVFPFADLGNGQFFAIVDPNNPTRALTPAADGSIAVTGPLTDALLRASAVAISNATDGRRTVSATVALALDTLGYTAGDALGALTQLPALSRLANQSVLVAHVRVTTNNSAFVPNLRVQLFNANAAGTASEVADNVPFAYLTADENGVWQGFVDLPPMSTTSVGSPTFAQTFDAFEHSVVTGANGDLYFQLTTLTTISAKLNPQVLTVTVTVREK